MCERRHDAACRCPACRVVTHRGIRASRGVRVPGILPPPPHWGHGSLVSCPLPLTGDNSLARRRRFGPGSPQTGVRENTPSPSPTGLERSGAAGPLLAAHVERNGRSGRSRCGGHILYDSTWQKVPQEFVEFGLKRYGNWLVPICVSTYFLNVFQIENVAEFRENIQAVMFLGG